MKHTKTLATKQIVNTPLGINELDELIEEHKIFKSNIQWESRERFQNFSSRLALTIAIIIIGVGLAGPISVLLSPIVYYYLKKLIPDSQRQDPFQRYIHK